MLTEQDALAFMHSNLDFIGKTITQDGDQKKIDMMRNYLQKFESGMSEEDMRELNREMLELALSSAENLTEEQRRQLEELRENVIPGESVSTDIQSKSSQNISGTNNETENTTRKYPSPAPRLRMKLVKIQVSDAKDFIGKTVKVKTIDGIDRTYRLIASSPNSLSFERREQGGMLTFEMERRNIRELKVFTRQPLR